MKTYNELIKFAKEKKIKHYRKYSRDKLQELFELEKKDTNTFYEKYCKGKWKIKSIIAINSKGEEIRSKSLYATGKYFNIYPSSIRWRILNEKKLKSKEDSWSFFYISQL